MRPVEASWPGEVFEHRIVGGAAYDVKGSARKRAAELWVDDRQQTRNFIACP